jgi:hypothetical protein
MDTDSAMSNADLEGMSLDQVLASVVEFEAEGSKSNIGAGARTEGNKFENLLVPLWKSFATTLEKITNTPVEYFSVDSLVWSKTRFNRRAVYLPAPGAVQKRGQSSCVFDKSSVIVFRPPFRCLRNTPIHQVI